MSVASVTLDNPPANSYDLAVMQQFAADVDAAIASDARVVVVRSASEKFFSAGADVKKFLDGDVEANMEMIRTSQAAFRRIRDDGVPAIGKPFELNEVRGQGCCEFGLPMEEVEHTGVGLPVLQPLSGGELLHQVLAVAGQPQFRQRVGA